MARVFNSPLINSILSDFRREAIVPEGQYTVMPGDDCFKIVVHDYTNLYFNRINEAGDLGVIFIFEDYYRHNFFSDDQRSFELGDERVRDGDSTHSLCAQLELEENLDAHEDNYRIITMKAVAVSDDEDAVVPEGLTIPHGEPLDVVEMTWAWDWDSDV